MIFGKTAHRGSPWCAADFYVRLVVANIRLLQILVMTLTLGTLGDAASIRVSMPFDGYASVNLYSTGGKVVARVLEAAPLGAGIQEIPVPESVPAGTYIWSGLAHRGLEVRLRGWAESAGDVPWETADGRGGWGGSGGAPSAVAADGERVYLGWDRALEGAAVVALDAHDAVTWRWRSASTAGCVALSEEAGILYVLTAPVEDYGGSAAVVRLDSASGLAVPWAGQESAELPITALWPKDAALKYREADAMAVGNGRIYLSFTEPGFIAVLDADTGAYVTTLTGPEPGAMALSTTPMADPDHPDRTLVADFGIVTIASMAVSYFVMPHDPPWIAANSTRRLPGNDRITALTMRGDTMRSGDVQLYLGLDVPHFQVHARPATDPRMTTYAAGRPGGRRGRGPWEPDALSKIRAMAFDAHDRLWIAEGGTRPPRFSVWSTEGDTGRLEAELFGPAPLPGALGGAIYPRNGDIMIGGNCEWRIDRHSGRAACLGVIPGPTIVEAQFAVAENDRDYLLAKHDDGSVSVFERIRDGDYRLRTHVLVKEGVATFWSETGTNGEVQRGETVDFAGVTEDALELAPELGLRFGVQRLQVESWSPTGAPIYGKWEGESDLVAPEVTDGRLCGTMEFPEPLGVVRVYARVQGDWWFVTEDGLVFGKLFDVDRKEVRPPESAEPGADMSRMKSGASEQGVGGSIVRVSDGRVVAQAGRTAYWNLAVTGFDSVEALPDGRIEIGPEESAR